MNRNTRLVAVLFVALLAATVASFVVYRALAAGSGPQQPQTIDTLVAAQVIPAGTMLTRDYVKVVGRQWLALIYHDRIGDTWHLERLYD